VRLTRRVDALEAVGYGFAAFLLFV